MRPTVEEQLLGTCRVLEKVVAPCVADPFARNILQGLIGNLRMLGGAVPAVPGFLRDDNAATAKLLALLQPALAPALAQRIAAALDEAAPDAVNVAALDERNQNLRALLAEAVRGEALTPEQHTAIVQYMSERASQAPMRYVSTAITTPANDKA